jgi:hypothetical protein
MRVSAQALWLPKAGNTPGEYEDACWPQEAIFAKEMARFRCAVADGATETSFSGLWANQLVREYCRRASVKQFVESLPRLRQEWQRQVYAKPLPWYAEEKARSGAFAAFLGLTVRRAAPNRKYPAIWEAVAIGDCCVFQVRAGQMLQAFPLERAEQFNSRPYLLGTRGPDAERLQENLTTARGGCEDGDAFYLMSDALACCFLSYHERGVDSFACLEALCDPAVFAAFVQEIRTRRDAEGHSWLRNDDVTLLRISLAL